MKHIHYLIMLGRLVFGWACEEEAELTPSGDERNWMIITEPDNDDPVDWLRYEIYRDYGVSTYYNDTIGSMERVDMNGTPYTYYERLKIFYAPGSSTTTYSTGDFALVKDHLKLEPVLESFRDDIFSRFAEGTRMPAFLFVDSIWYVDSWTDDSIRMDSYYGYNTVVITLDSLEVYGLEKLTNKSLGVYCGGVLSSSTHSGWSASFAAVTSSLNLDVQYWFGHELAYVLEETGFTEKEQMGFIISVISVNGVEETPSELEDLQSYVEAVTWYSEDEFEAIYGEYVPCMEKYRMMRKQLEVIGYQFEE